MTQENELMKCEAHELLEREIERCKNNEQELYTLDRTRSQTMAEIQQDIAEIKVDSKNMKEDLKEFKQDLSTVKQEQSEVKTDVKDLNKKVEEVQIEVKEIKKIVEKTVQKKKWEPKDLAIVIVALLSLIGTIVTALIK